MEHTKQGSDFVATVSLHLAYQCFHTEKSKQKDLRMGFSS